MPAKTLLLTAATLICAASAHAQEAPKAETSKSTDEVVVKADKKAVKKTIDKTVYSTRDNPAAENGSAQDVLQSTPGVSVSAEGSVAVKGNANVTVLINGKPSAQMSGENRAVALQTMAGSDIASVEVITNPSAAYAGNGGAIINIVLKKNRKPGGHGSLRAALSDQGLWTAGGAGDYSRGKLSVHASATVRRDGTLKFRGARLDARDPLSGHRLRNEQSSEVFVRRVVRSASVGLDYDIDDDSSVTASAGSSFRRSRPWFSEAHTDYDNAVLSRVYRRNSNGPNQQSDEMMNVAYNHVRDDRVFKAAIQSSATFNLVDKSFETAFVAPAQPSDFGRAYTKFGRRLDQATLDYTLPLSGGQAGMGLDLQRTANSIGNYLAALDTATGAETVDLNATNRYRAVDTVRAAYLTWQVTRGRLEALAGARFEAATTELLDGQGVRLGRSAYQALNPSLHLKYSLDPEKSVTVSYSQSLQRPDPRDLNPYVTYQDTQNVSTGNPALRPQGVRSWELTWNADGKDFSRSLGLFWRRSHDTVIDAQYYTGTVLVTGKDNGGRGRSAGLTGSIDRRTGPWHLTGDATLYAVALESRDLGAPVRQDGASWAANASLGYSKGADDISLDVHGEGAGISPLGTYSGAQALNIAWRHKLDTRWTVTLNATDVFDGAKKRFTTTTSTFSQSGFNHFVAQRVYIGLVWRPD